MTPSQHGFDSDHDSVDASPGLHVLPLLPLWLVFVAGVAGLGTAPIVAQTVTPAVDCPEPYRIEHRFDNGNGWQFCWQARQRENLVLYDVHFLPGDAAPYRVLASARLAQLHVAYDDSTVTYNDITDFGLGGSFRTTLDERDCPNGELFDADGRPAICLLRNTSLDAYRSGDATRQAQSLTLFSSSQVGAYSYTLSWKLFDDGSIVPAVGAAGALQRSSDWAGSPYGRVLADTPEKSWLSHTHNYYFRLDFDLGEHDDDDVVTEISYPPATAPTRRQRRMTLDREAARAFAPEQQLHWTITDGADADGSDADRQARGYRIEPLAYGHRLVRTVIEPYTAHDFFVTRQNDCERFASDNAKYNPDCLADVEAFTNGEYLVGADIVVWHRISFHHVPRNEDRSIMHSHWDGFTLEAMNLHATQREITAMPNRAPTMLPIASQHVLLGTTVTLPVVAADLDDDTIVISAEGLPTGLQLDAANRITGTVTEAGTYPVVISASDGQLTTPFHLQWQVHADANALNAALQSTSTDGDHGNTASNTHHNVDGVGGVNSGGSTGNSVSSNTGAASAGTLAPGMLLLLMAILRQRRYWTQPASGPSTRQRH